MIISPQKIITGDGKSVLVDTAIHIDDTGTITDLASARILKEKYPDDLEICYPNSTVLPGVADIHIHIGFWEDPVPEKLRNPMSLAMHCASRMNRALKRGITLVRDMASPELAVQSLNTAAEFGWFDLPRMIGCGAGLCITGGHCYFYSPDVLEVDGKEELVKEIRRHFRDGYRWTKLMTTDRTQLAEFTLEEMTAAAQETHRLGGKITVHAGNRAGIQTCIDANVDGVEHGVGMTEQQAQAMIEKGMYWTPTIHILRQTYLDYKAQNHVRDDSYTYFETATQFFEEKFLKYYKMGVPVAAGTDLDDFPVIDELEEMVRLGLSPLEAIKVGCHNGACAVGLGDITGLVAAGYSADFMVVDGDVEKDVSLMKRPKAVYFKGKQV